jgi:exodeoxyribonuclease V alpha subunit
MAGPAESRQPNGSSSGLPGAGQPTEVLAGSIEGVTFHNPSNGICVLRIKARGHRELVTVVGHAAEIRARPYTPVTNSKAEWSIPTIGQEWANAIAS